MGKRGSKPTSLWDILGGGGPNGGYRYKSSGGASITVGKAADKRASGGKYVSVTRSDGGKKSNVYDKNGRRIISKKNSGW